MKKYRLKKDTPHFDKGTILEDDGFTLCGNGIQYLRSNIKDFNDWFEEYKEPKWTDDDMIDFVHSYLSDTVGTPARFALERFKKDHK